MGFHKILKKHDKHMSIPCRQFYIERLQEQRWISSDFSIMFVRLSHVHSRLRGDGAGKQDSGAAQSFVRKTTKDWVRTEDISQVKFMVMEQLPVSQFNPLPGDSQLCNSVYLDNDSMELYRARLNKTPGALAIRLRWYDTGDPKVV